MKTMNKWLLLPLITFCILSFAPAPGGEGYEIYLGDRLLLQHFGHPGKEVKSLPLPAVTSNEQLVIKYFHCGKIGKQRSITLKDGKDQLLKQFRYADVNTTRAAMSLRLDEIKKAGKNSEVVKMYYASSELPAGRCLVSFTVDQKAFAGR
jgi:hypothetical protein